MTTLEIPGDYLEGGGQLLRTAVALSAVTGNSVYIDKIRANRVEPGIRPSHLASIKAISEICGGSFDAKIGDTELEFKPGKIKSDQEIKIDTGTAGSIPLILQAIMIPAAHAKNLEIEIKGGTSTKWSPTISYMENVTLPILKKMGYNASIEVVRHGFYPKGGGIVIFRSEKSKLKPTEGFNPGKIINVEGKGTITKDLKKNDVGDRLKAFSRDKLFKKFRIVPQVGFEYVDSFSTGAVIDVFVRTENSIWGASSLGETRKRIEYVVDEAVNQLGKEAKSNHFLDEYMADQILPYMAMTKRSGFSVAKITNHAKTNAWVIEKFLPVKFEIDTKYNVITSKSK